MADKLLKIGFIGLGKMGKPIAKRLISQGYQVIVYDINKDLCSGFPESAANIADMPGSCDVIMLSLPGSNEVRSVVEKILVTGISGKYIIDLSTSYPLECASLYSLAKDSGNFFADAPLTGNPATAATGELNAIVGGEKDVYDSLLSLFASFTKKTYYAGKAGSGNLIKLCANYLACMQISLYAEIIPLIEKSGGDYQIFYDVISNSVVNCGIFQRIAPKIHNDDYEITFLLKHGIKDLGYVKDIFEENSYPSIVLDAGLNLYKMAKCYGMDNEDISSVARIIKDFMKN